MEDDRLCVIVLLIDLSERCFEIGCGFCSRWVVHADTRLACGSPSPQRLREVTRGWLSNPPADPTPSAVRILGCHKSANMCPRPRKQLTIIGGAPAHLFHIAECVGKGEQVASACRLASAPSIL